MGKDNQYKHIVAKLIEGKVVIQFYLEPMPHPDDFKNNNKEYALLRYNSSLKNWQSSVKTANIKEEDGAELHDLIYNKYFYHGQTNYFRQCCKQGINIQSLEDRILIERSGVCAVDCCFTASLLEEKKDESQEDLFTALIDVLMDSKSLNPHQDKKTLMKQFEIKRKK